MTHPYGAEVVWLDAITNGTRIEIHAQAACARKREVVETVEEHSRREAQFEAPGVRAQNGGDLIFIAFVSVATMTVSTLVTGVVLLFSGEDQRRFDRPGPSIVETSVRPAPRQLIRVFIGGDRTDVVTDDAGMAQVRLAEQPAHVVVETARRGDAVLIFDYDPAKPLAIHEHPQPPVSGNP